MADRESGRGLRSCHWWALPIPGCQGPGAAPGPLLPVPARRCHYRRQGDRPAAVRPAPSLHQISSRTKPAGRRQGQLTAEGCSARRVARFTKGCAGRRWGLAAGVQPGNKLVTSISWGRV